MKKETAGAMRTIILIHEVRGVTDNLRRLGDLLASRGFSVLVPSLYPDGFSGADEEAAYRKFFSEVGIESAKRTIDSLIDALIDANPPGDVTVIGFSVGATVAWLESANPAVKSVIGVYGSRIREYLDVSPLADTQLLFCAERAFDVNAILPPLNAKPRVTARLIEGVHGFYSREDFDSPAIQGLNATLLALLDRR